MTDVVPAPYRTFLVRFASRLYESHSFSYESQSSPINMDLVKFLKDEPKVGGPQVKGKRPGAPPKLRLSEVILREIHGPLAGRKEPFSNTSTEGVARAVVKGPPMETQVMSFWWHILVWTIHSGTHGIPLEMAFCCFVRAFMLSFANGNSKSNIDADFILDALFSLLNMIDPDDTSGLQAYKSAPKWLIDVAIATDYPYTDTLKRGDTYMNADFNEATRGISKADLRAAMQSIPKASGNGKADESSSKGKTRPKKKAGKHCKRSTAASGTLVTAKDGANQTSRAQLLMMRIPESTPNKSE